MKSFIIIFAVAFMAMGFTAINTNNCNAKQPSCCTSSSCCSNCTDAECKATCKAVSELTTAEAESEKGKKLIATCKTLCEKNDCCKDSKKCNKHKK